MEEKQKVRVDWFLADVATVEIEVTQELMGAMIGTAFQYLKVNGDLPWEKWSLLSEVSRSAFMAAAEQLKTREIVDLPQ